ncbi:hypothetical protein [Microbacterium rhizomatis]|uniref:Uncharacterized protein n=1 Tax=Microbacterium rhizomatis TaxID=1631477 RepID=A0A5J5J1V2_9MICO|nr:hypothetical protein [Microbacterium rhizomatis]KAA9110157.1 hypothetical protein F6B43_00135 [Microbacterium rhizomatis]
MATQLHYYGSVFDLTEDTDDDLWSRLIDGYLEQSRRVHGMLTIRFELNGGGYVSLRLGPDTPLGVVQN